MTKKREFCLSQTALSSIHITYDSNQKLQSYVHHLPALFTDGRLYFYDNPKYYSQYPTAGRSQGTVNEYFSRIVNTSGVLEQIDARWANHTITAYLGGEPLEIDMVKLPTFYKILFYNAAMSTTCVPKDGKTVKAYSFPPNLLLDLTTHYFVVINNNAESPIFVHDESQKTTTSSTPVTLLGTHVTTESGHIIGTAQTLVIPKFC